MKEKRRRKRVQLGMKVQITLEGNTYPATCLNVSMSGMLLLVEHCPRDLSQTMGQTGTFILQTVCGEQQLVIKGTFEVVRFQQPDASPSEAAAQTMQVGVHFVDLDTESSIHLYTMIRWQDVD